MQHEKVKVTVHLTAEAAGILRDYASERSRGMFLSQLLVAQRVADDKEGQRVLAQLDCEDAVGGAL